MLPGGGVLSISKPSVLVGRETCMLPGGRVVSTSKPSFSSGASLAVVAIDAVEKRRRWAGGMIGEQQREKKTREQPLWHG
ncbi:expressed unknown protein [Ectocarpus siliculosus]|uniref:Uncharacterized protein n=1 Tax=Ectocarpus siliculosus TaxID=2880 RepID=D7FN38_ECTSI|nr:expressed unknown protein [Ectocarpus siliculosus]|eukprot:CBJ34252.1 expressed unknown protein [Ectocarpus siliculosus]